MLPILQIGPFSIRTPGLALIVAVWVGLELASRQGNRLGLEPERVYNVGIYSLGMGIIGARLGFVLLNLELYTHVTPWTRALGAVFSLSPGTESAVMGILAAAGLAAWLTRRWQIPPLVLADALAPGIAVLIAGIGIAVLFSGSFYGSTTHLPWGIPLNGVSRHPTQLLLFLTGVAALIATLRNQIDERNGTLEISSIYAPGSVLQRLLIVVGTGLLLIEPLRADSQVIGNGIRVWAIVGLIMILGSLGGNALRTPTGVPDQTTKL